MGRPPKPTSDHERDGTFRPHRHADRADTAFEQGPPSMPEGLDGHGRWLWRLVEENVPHQILSPADAASLIVVCKLWSVWRRLDDEMDTAEGDAAYKVATMLSAMTKQLTAGLARFGLSPRDRASLKLPASDAPQEDALTKLMRARSAN